MVIVFLLGLVVGAAAATLLLLWLTVPRLEQLYVFRPSRDILKTPKQVGAPFEQHFIETPDGCKLNAWHLCPDEPVASILYFHGNGGNLGILSEILAMFYRHQLEVLAVDYRGYGYSTGVPSEAGLCNDALATVEYFEKNLRNNGLPLILWGRSLGACFASYAAARSSPNGLILETAFPSKKSLLKHFPRLKLFQPFSRCRFETVRHLENYYYPVLLIHGDRDRTVPIKEGRSLFECLNGPKEFFSIPGAGHIDLHLVDTEAYMRRILFFIRSLRQQTVH